MLTREQNTKLKADIATLIDAATETDAPPPTPPPPPVGALRWSDPSAWPTGRVPTASDDVEIPSGTTVTIDDESAVCNEVVVRGRLVFAVDRPVKLKCRTIRLEIGGELECGTESARAIDVQVTFANLPVVQREKPEDEGNGLVCCGGKITVHGLPKAGFIRLAIEPKAGDTTLTLSESAVGWKIGDRLLMADTRQEPSRFEQIERPTLKEISADLKTVTLTAPLQFDHLGGLGDRVEWDGDRILIVHVGGDLILPHVANTTHSVVFRSESMVGVRAHTLFTGDTEVDIRYAGFGGIGRTKNDRSTPDGRYPVHFHRLKKPPKFIGNSITCPLIPMPFKWGLAIHGTDGGLYKGNVLYNWAGAGIATEDGTESGNVIEGNFVCRVEGTGERETHLKGVAGDGYWIRGQDNHVRGNVAANCMQFGFVFWEGGPFREVVGCEIYGGRDGLTTWFINGADTGASNPNAPQSTIKNTTVWGCWHVAVGLGYASWNLTFDGVKVRGFRRWDKMTGIGFYYGDYQTKDFVLRNFDIQGCDIGIDVPLKGGPHRLPPNFAGPIGEIKIENCYLHNFVNIQVRTPSGGGNGSGRITPERRTIIHNVRYGPAYDPSWRTQMKPAQILMQYEVQNPGSNFLARDEVIVTNHNGVAGDNFRVYYPEQRGDFVLPATPKLPSGEPDTNFWGSREAGLTNQQHFEKYGECLGGELLPADAALREGIIGLVKRF